MFGFAGDEGAPRSRRGYEGAPRPPRRTRRRLILTVLAAVLGVVLLTAVAAPYSLYRRIETVDIDLDSWPGRPAKAVPDAVDIAVLGKSDDRCVSLMVFHIAADRLSGSFVSIPGSGLCGPDSAASNDLRPGDVERTAAEVERAGDVRLDHLAVLDWNAFAELVDLVDGVTVTVDEASADVRWPAGKYTLWGSDVADFVAGTALTPADELSRIGRQQILLCEVLRTTLHQEMRKDPRQLYTFLRIVTGNLAVDREWSETELARLAFSIRNLRSADIDCLTAPDLSEPTGADSALWNSVRHDVIGGN